jgi:hypothetical protein
VIKQTGVIKGKTRRVLDSTVLDDAVATQDTVTQLVAAIRRVLRVVPGAEAVLVGRETACDYTRPGKPEIAWDDKAAKAALINALVLDALTLLNALSSTDTDSDTDADGGTDGDADDGAGDGTDEAGQALALLALLAGQDVEWIDDGAGGGVWRIARKVAHDRVISTVDTETRHAHKSRSRKQDGFKAHIAAEPDTGLITNAALTKATGEGTGDAAAGAAVLAGDDSFTEPGQVLADSAYGTGDLLNDLHQAGHDPVIKPWPCTPKIPGGFGVDDFTVDHQARVVTCPAGNTASFTAKTRTAKFGTACAACPFRDQCTTAAAGRSVTVNVHDQIQRAHRARWNTDPQMRADYRKHRPMVERSIAWLTRGARRLRYRGVTKNDAWLKLRVSGINLRQLCATGLTRTAGGWQIAT